MAKHLWEIKHPYYMNEGNYYSNECHTNYETWDDFIAEYGDADQDYNWFVRWDWLEGQDNGAGEYRGDDYYRNGLFKLQRIAQRKSILDSHTVRVCRADEPQILKYLESQWVYMQSMWAPFANKETA